MSCWTIFVTKAVKRYLVAKKLSKVTGENVRVIMRNIVLIETGLKQSLPIVQNQNTVLTQPEYFLPEESQALFPECWQPTL